VRCRDLLLAFESACMKICLSVKKELIVYSHQMRYTISKLQYVAHLYESGVLCTSFLEQLCKVCFCHSILIRLWLVTKGRWTMGLEAWKKTVDTKLFLKARGVLLATCHNMQIRFCEPLVQLLFCGTNNPNFCTMLQFSKLYSSLRSVP
jgi:hypothetical protein